MTTINTTVNYLRQNIEDTHKRIDSIQQFFNNSPTQLDKLLPEVIDELSNSLEELSITVEQLEEQNNQLLSTRLDLEREKRRYQELFEEAPDGYIITNIRGVIEEANGAAANLLNLKWKYLVGKPLVVFVPPENRKAFNSQLDDITQLPSFRNWQVLLQPRELQPISVAISISIRRDCQEQPVGLRWLLHDLSKYKQLEKDLLDKFPTLIWRSNSKGEYDYFNQTWLDFTGLTIEQQQDKGVVETIHPDDQERYTKTYLEALKQGQLFQLEYRLRHHQLGYRSVCGFAQPFYDTNGSLSGYICNCYDLTEYYQAKEELKESEKREREKAAQLELTLRELKSTQVQLFQSAKMSSLGVMLAGVAHEINNPVSFISCNLPYLNEYFQYLLKQIQICQSNCSEHLAQIDSTNEGVEVEFILEDLPKLLNSMQTGTERIQRIVSSLSNFSRQSQSQSKPVDIHQNIDDTLLILQHRLKGLSDCPAIKVIQDYGQLPLVRGYPGNLNQVFLNLLTNAIDALESRFVETEQPITPQIVIRTETISTESLNSANKTTEKVVIRIIDNGNGMKGEVLAQIFDPFFTTKPVGKGTGLGLSVSQQIIEKQHQGKLSCLSTLGKGTEFVIELPIS